MNGFSSIFFLSKCYLSFPKTSLLKHPHVSQRQQIYFKIIPYVFLYALFEGVPSKPGTPQIVRLGEDQLTLTWDAPLCDGGCPVTHYVLERRETRGPQWLRMRKNAVQVRFYDGYFYCAYDKYIYEKNSRPESQE